MEEGVGLLPSPNWYGAQLADWGAAADAPLVAYAARNSVLLLRPLSQQVVGSLTGHTNRVTAVVFLRAPGLEHMVLTGCADRAVRLWDSGTLRCVRTLRGHAAEVTALAASPVGADLGVSGDRSGAVLLWRAAGDAPAPAGPLLDSPVVSLAFSLVNACVAAAGCANGAVALLDVAAGTLLRRLAAHSGDVQALAFTRLPAGGALLATGGRDRAVHLWQIGGDAATAVLRGTHHVPKAAAGMSEAQRDRLWVALAWLPPRASDGAMQLAGSGYGGDIMVWDLLLPALTASAPQKLGPPALAHTRSVFSVVAGSASGRRFMLSTSMDRGVALWDADVLTHLWTLPGLGGFVYALATSPLLPQHIAVACGDKTIRLWEPRSDGSAARITLLWKGISGKVLTLAFHPERENWLAFGTEEGRVGVYDVSAQSYASHAGRHAAPVMTLSWRRVCGAPSRLCSLAADGALLEWRAELALSTTPRDLVVAQERPLAELTRSLSEEMRAAAAGSAQLSDPGTEPGLITDAAWCPAGALLAVGRECGALEVWKHSADGWACPTHLWAHAKGVTRVRWHPSTQPLGSRRLLSTATDGTLCVFDDASWSPHADTTFATASVDGSIRVWDTASVPSPAAQESTGAALRSVMRGHDGRALAVCWSASRDDVVFSGSEDQTVRIWLWEHERHAPKPPAAPAKEEAADCGEAVQPPAAAAVSTAGAASKQPAASQPRRRRQAAAAKSVLSPVTHDAAELLTACVSLARLSQDRDSAGQAPTSRVPFHALPMSQEDALTALVIDERDALAASSGSASPAATRAAERAATLALFRGDVGAAAEALVAADALSGDFVSAAAGAGHAAWAHLTTAYAGQLEARGEPHLAALQWLALHDVRAAVGTLRRAGLARDALVLATARLLPDDALLPLLRAELGAAEESSGAYEGAALCYVAAGQAQAAVRVLGRCQGEDVAAAKVALMLAKQGNRVAQRMPTDAE